MKKRNYRWILFFLALLTPTHGWSWGAVGHRAIGIIAEQELSAKTKAAIQRFTTENLAELSVWPDAARPKPEWKHTAWYHFANIPDGSDYFSSLSNMPAPIQQRGDVVLAMLQAEEILRSKGEDVSVVATNEKRNALAFLVHFLGDIHQPFHSGRPEDRGGNDLRFVWFGKKTNLHAVWDGLIISSVYGDSFANIPDPVRAKVYVDQINHPNNAQIKSWLVGYYNTWAQESVNLRLNPYSGYNNNQEVYRDTYIGIVNERILQAGYRLAAILNHIFDPNPSTEIVNLENSIETARLQLEKILGSYDEVDRIIFLKPRAVLNADEKKKISSILESPPECEHDEEHTH